MKELTEKHHKWIGVNMPLKSDIKIGVEIEFIYEGGKKHKK